MGANQNKNMINMISRATASVKNKAKSAIALTYLRKGRKRIEPVFLSSSVKRKQREEAQRIHAQARERLRSIIREFQDSRRKTTGLSSKRIKGGSRLSKVESGLVNDMEEAHYQAGGVVTGAVMAAGAGVALAAHRITTDVSKVTTDASALISNANEVVSNLANKVERPIMNASSLLEQLENALKAFVENVQRWGGFMWKVALGGIIMWLLNKWGVSPAVTAMLYAFVLKIAPELVSHLFGKEEAQAQSGVSSMATFISMVCTCWIPGRDVKSVTGEFMKRVSHFPRATEGLETFLTKVLETCEKFVNFVMRRSEDNLIRLTSKTNAFQLWTEQTIKYVRHIAKEVTLNMADLQKIREHYLMGFGFYEVLVTETSKRELKMWMEKLALALRPHEGALSKMANVRPMPACVMLGGQSGVGKTSLIRFMASMTLLLSGEVTASEALSHLWQKGTTQFWNGWVGQKCLVIDDAFQVKGKPGDMDSEAMQLIRAIGNWAYPLNFADVDSKGKFYLNTPLVVGTTNCANVKDEWKPFLTQPEALVRRFQFAYWVELNGAYADEHGRFDYNKVRLIVNQRVRDILERTAKGEKFTTDQIMDIVPWEAWNIKPHNFCGDVRTQVDQSGIKNLVRTVADTIRDRKKANEEEIKDLDDILSLIERVQRNADVPAEEGSFESVVLEAGGDRLSRHSCDSINIDMAELSSHLREPELVTGGCDTWEKGVQDVEDDTSSCMDEIPTLRPFSPDGAVFETSPEYHAALRTGESRHFRLITDMKDCLMSWAHRTYEMAFLGFAREDFTFGKAMKHLCITLVIGFVIQMAKTAACFLGKIIAGLFGWRPETKECTVEEQSNAGNGVKTKGASKFTFVTADKILPPVAEYQVGTPPQEGCGDKVYNNTFKAVLTNGSEEYILGQFIGVGSDVFIFPKHFLRDMRNRCDGWKVTFYHARASSQYTLEMTVAQFLGLHIAEVADYDIAAVAFGRFGIKSTKNITHLFLPQEVINRKMRHNNTQVNLHVFNWDVKDGKVLKQRDRLSSATCESVQSIRTEQGDVLNGIVKYRAPTRSGDCGAPLILTEESGACVLGFHSAGRTVGGIREGFSTVVSQEAVLALFQRVRSYSDWFGHNDVREITEAEEAAVAQSGITGGSVHAIGMLTRPVSQATMTKLKPSLMQAEKVLGEPISAPAHLRPVTVGDMLVLPMQKGIEAYQSPQVCMDPTILEPVVDMAMRRHWEATTHHYKGVLTFEEALSPPDDIKLKPINRKTSPGFKYRDCVTARTPGKTFALGYEGDIDFTKEHFVNAFGDPDWRYVNAGLEKVHTDVQECIYHAEKNVRLTHLCVDFLKDELRPLEKVASVSTRVISGTEMDYTIAVRMYFGAFMAASFATHTRNGMAPGINHYTEWAVLAEELLSKGTAIFDGDFSRFDAGEQPWIHEAILQYINRWYRQSPTWTEQEERVRNILWLDLVHSRHITGSHSSLNVVVQWNKSLPSGHPLTTIVNSMYSLITIAGCYVSVTSSYDMWDHCCVVTFGDDNITSVSEQRRDVFNQVSVASEMKTLFNLDYTAGNKSGTLVPYTDIHNVTFLKRSFAEDEPSNSLIANTPFVGWVAPLDPNSFLYEGYWYKNARAPMEDLKDRLNHTLGELALHPSHMWDEYAPKICSWADKNNISLDSRDRVSCRHNIKTRFDVWF